MLYELPEPEQTLMELRTSSLVPPEAVADLNDRLGDRFLALSETARLALITAWVEGVVRHDRLKQICADHPADLTKILGALVRDGMLSPSGSGRGTVYFLPWQHKSIVTLFDATDRTDVLPEHGSISPESLAETPELAAITPELAAIAPELGQESITSVQPVLDWSSLPVASQEELAEIARPVSGQGRVAPSTLRVVVQALCMGRHLGLRVLAHVLQRDPDDLRKRTLTPMVKESLLRTSYPSLRDPRQAYTTIPRPADDKHSV